MNIGPPASSSRAVSVLMLEARGVMSGRETEDTLAPSVLTAVVVVEGIAVGRASVWASDPRPQALAGTCEEEHRRLARAIRRATRGVEELVRLLPQSEAELFEPEVTILGEVGPLMLARVDAGERAEDAVNHTLSAMPADLLVDAHARLLDGLARNDRTIEALLESREGDRVLVTEKLTPSIVAALPARVVGIIAGASDEDRGGGHTSHAAILARGRVIPLVIATRERIKTIRDDDRIVLDATTQPASVWVRPVDATVEGATKRREAWALARAEEEVQVVAKLSHVGLEVHVNVGSLHEHVPTSAEGVGLVRTELIFADWATTPSPREQLAALRAIGARAGQRPVVVRLFDAGGDKPLPWLKPADVEPSQCGIRLLLANAQVLDAQLQAISHAAKTMDVRVLLPFVACADDVVRVRSRLRTGSEVPVGAMIETPEAVERSDSIVAAADFVCIGTNDLFACVTGHAQAGSTLALDRRVLRMIGRVVAAAHGHGRKVSVCGEMAGEPHSARVLVGLGVDAISVAIGRFASVKLSFRDVSIDDCKQVAAEALK